MEKQLVHAAPKDRAAFFSLVRHRVKFQLYLFRNLPAAFFSGVRVVKADTGSCDTTVPFKRFTKNPFRSTYFACLSMAAELSTGVLAMAAVYRRRPAVSLLITGMEAKFFKKATGLTTFSCTDGKAITDAVDAAVDKGIGQEVTVHTTGKNSNDETVAEFWFTWSFKAR